MNYKKNKKSVFSSVLLIRIITTVIVLGFLIFPTLALGASIQITDYPQSVVAGEEFNVVFSGSELETGVNYYEKAIGGDSNYDVQIWSSKVNNWLSWNSQWTDMPELLVQEASPLATIKTKFKSDTTAGIKNFLVRLRKVGTETNLDSVAVTISVSTPTPTATSTPTATPTEAPIATSTATTTATAVPTKTPTPSPKGSPSGTPKPKTPTPTPKGSPEVELLDMETGEFALNEVVSTPSEEVLGASESEEPDNNSIIPFVFIGTGMVFLILGGITFYKKKRP